MKKLNVKLPQGGSKRALHSGMYASALAVVVLAVTILVNLVIRALPTKYTEYDISTTSLFTLSDTTENLLHELNTDVTAYYLAESGQEDANITRLLDRYAGESSHFSWQQRDPVLYPTFAQQYDGASAGSVVLVCGDNSDVLSYNDMYEMDLESYYTTGTANYSFQAENALTSGIAKVTRTAAYQLYELTGHGETALSGDFTDTLSNAGVTVTSLNLTTAGSIPADVSAVLINAPGADLTDAETTILKDYVANGGKLFVTTDFTTGTPNLDSVLADCGMARQPGLLIETDTDHYPYGYPQTYLLPTVVSNEITAGVSQSMMVYTPIAQGITTDFIHLEQGMTRINVKIKAGQETELNGAGPDIPESAMEQLEAQLDKLAEGDILILAGSIPSSLPQTTYERLLARLEGHGVHTVVDATRDLLVNVLQYHPFLIKPNNHELGEIVGRTLTTDADITAAARTLQEKGARNVLVSMAGDGALLLDEKGEVHRIGTPKGKVVNSVGAGDSMVAGFVAGYLRSGSYLEALRLGTACGSATAFSLGLAKKEKIDALLATI